MNIDLNSPDARLELADHLGLDVVTDGELDRAWVSAVMLPSSPSLLPSSHLLPLSYDVELIEVRIERRVGFHRWVETRQVRRVTER